MSQIVIVSSKEAERQVIEALHHLNEIHLVSHVETKEGPLAGFKIGAPLAGANESSGQLVRLRSIIRALGLDGHRPAAARPAKEIDDRLPRALPEAEAETERVAGARERAKHELDQLAEEARKLEPLAGLPLDLSLLSGYRTLKVFIGSADAPVEGEVQRLSPHYEIYPAASGAFALFVPAEKADAVADALFKLGYKDLEVPAAKGTVDARIAEIARRRIELEAQVAAADAEIEKLRAKWADFVVAADEHLSIAVEKAEAPLSFAATAHAFVVQAWVPEASVARVRTALDKATSGRVHVEVVESGHGHHEAGHGDVHEHAAGSEGNHEEPPTRMRNFGWARPYETFTSLFSTPKYSEVDPTTVLALTFPFFYGFMIGDLGYGVIMAALGAAVILKLRHIGAAKALGTALLTAGIIAAAFGGVVFHDAFGIPFYAHHDVAPEAGMTLCESFAHHTKETTWSCILSGQQELVVHDAAQKNWWEINKLTDMSTLLVLSVIVAILHLGIGLVFGIVNEVGHSKKHATAKAAWLILLVGFFLLVIGQTTSLSELSRAIAEGPLEAAMEGWVTIALIVTGAVLLLLTEGVIALVEMPSLLANILSYTRLAGVAVAKAAMAVAFNGLFLVGMVMGHKGILLVIVGGLLVVLTQSLVLVLGILSSGIQAIRLNWVEFFTKFYKGGGKPFTPFGRRRQYTIETSPSIME